MAQAPLSPIAHPSMERVRDSKISHFWQSQTSSISSLSREGDQDALQANKMATDKDYLRDQAAEGHPSVPVPVLCAQRIQK